MIFANIAMLGVVDGSKFRNSIPWPENRLFRFNIAHKALWPEKQTIGFKGLIKI